jgi:UDP-N-acetylglucosamine 2-epimerase
MIKIAHIIGARPQFIKCASVSRAIRRRGNIDEIILHTGQHYDPNMSEVFFKELEIPEPNINLGIGSGTHAVQTSAMLSALEKSLEEIMPDWVLVYGDTNSTLAASLAAVKLGLRIAHVEAGLRSFNRNMPEEINRVVTDHVADLLLAPTLTAMKLLEKEGLKRRSVLTGDVMYDSVLHSVHLAERRFKHQPLVPFNEFYLATVHRQENTDDPHRLGNIIKAFSLLDLPVVLPIHPRTRKTLNISALPSRIRITDPVGYLEMLMLLQRSRKVFTDSGGLQKEAYFLKKQCITLRDETEWTETLEHNWNIITGVQVDKIIAASQTGITGPRGDYFGDGNASVKILDTLLKRDEGTT